MISLTTFELHALEVLGQLEMGQTTYPSAVGFELQTHCDPAMRKQNPSLQGMALFAGKYLRVLREHGLASQYKGWSATCTGRKLLASYGHTGSASPQESQRTTKKLENNFEADLS